MNTADNRDTVEALMCELMRECDAVKISYRANALLWTVHAQEFHGSLHIVCGLTLADTLRGVLVQVRGEP